MKKRLRTAALMWSFVYLKLLLPYLHVVLFIHNINKQFRFLVMPRFGSDLHKIWLNADKKFHRSTVNQVAVSLVSLYKLISY